MKKLYIGAVIILLLGVVVWVGIFYQRKSPGDETAQANVLIGQVDYLCEAGKTINAKYYQGPEAEGPQPGEPPTPTGSVELILSDGRQLTLPQTISGSGIRYATTGEALIFWSKGNGAFIMENDVQIYSVCIATAPNFGDLPQVYASSSAGFSIRYLEGYTVDPFYQYQGLGPGKEISGVKFTIPTEMAAGTNLSGFDTGVSVEEISDTSDCNAGLFVYPANSGIFEITDNGVQYSMATSSGAGAGNFYEETIWAIPGANPCVAVRYFIHSTNIDNYPSGTVQEFNLRELINQFDAVRRTLILNP